MFGPPSFVPAGTVPNLPFSTEEMRAAADVAAASAAFSALVRI
jgi:hypothetical protein